LCVLDIEIEDLEEIDEQAVIDEGNYYKENIFNKEDYYLFRAVMYFYADEYDKSVGDYNQTSKIMHSNKHLNRSQNNFGGNESNDMLDDRISNTSSQTDLSDVGL
jgi:hypothetical protein